MLCTVQYCTPDETTSRIKPSRYLIVLANLRSGSLKLLLAARMKVNDLFHVLVRHWSMVALSSIDGFQ
jgi:hypothetical protein